MADFKQRLAERITDVVARKYATVATAIVAPKEPYVKSRSKIPSLDDFANGSYSASFYRPLQSIRKSSSTEAIAQGSVVRGRVVSLPTYGLLIALQGVIVFEKDHTLTEKSMLSSDRQLRSLCYQDEMPRTMRLSDFKADDEIFGLVLSVDRENERVLLSFRPALLSETKRRLIQLGLRISDATKQSEPSFADKDESKAGYNSYSSLLSEFAEFRNPFSLDDFVERFKVNTRTSFFCNASQGNIPMSELSSSIRRRQDEAFASESVAVGVTHQKAKRFQEAAHYYNRALKTCPNHVDGLVARGTLHTASEEYDLAAADLTRAMSLNPQHKNASNYLEITLLRRGLKQVALGKFDEAAVDFSSAMDLKGPKYDDAVKELESVKRALERRSMSAKSFEAATRSTYSVAVLPSPKSEAKDLVSQKEKDTLTAIKALLLKRASKDGSSETPKKAKKEKNKHKHKDHKHDHKEHKHDKSEKKRRHSHHDDHDSSSDNDGPLLHTKRSKDD